jgi:hypothetical protein
MTTPDSSRSWTDPENVVTGDPVDQQAPSYSNERLGGTGVR